MAHHPLDPLTADEIRQAVSVLRRDRDVTERWRIASIELREPSKAAVRDHEPGAPLEREARVVCWNRDDGRTHKALVSLTGDRVTEWRHEPDGQPNLTLDEVHECDVAMRREPRVIEALARRGITDMDRVLVEAWAYGAHLVPEQYSSRRLAWGVWYRKQPGANPYANHVTGLHFVIDLNRMELLEVQDDGGDEEPETMGEYIPRLVPGQRLRDDVKAAGDRTGRRRVLHPGGQPAAVAEVVIADRLQPPRGPRPAHRRLRGRRAHPRGRAPAVVCRDGRPLPRPDVRPLPAHRV